MRWTRFAFVARTHVWTKWINNRIVGSEIYICVRIGSNYYFVSFHIWKNIIFSPSILNVKGLVDGGWCEVESVIYLHEMSSKWIVIHRSNKLLQQQRKSLDWITVDVSEANRRKMNGYFQTTTHFISLLINKEETIRSFHSQTHSVLSSIQLWT